MKNTATTTQPTLALRRVAFAVVAAPLLLFGAGIATAYANPLAPTPQPSPVDPIDAMLNSPNPPAGIQLPGIPGMNFYNPMIPNPAVTVPGGRGIPVPGIYVPGMPVPVIPLPQQDLPDLNLGI
jgi:hypothetical protein